MLVSGQQLPNPWRGRSGTRGITSDGGGPEDAPVAKPLGSREVQVGDGSVGLGCVEDRGAQVGGGRVVEVAQGVGVVPLQHRGPAARAARVPHVAVLVHWLGQCHLNRGPVQHLRGGERARDEHSGQSAWWKSHLRRNCPHVHMGWEDEGSHPKNPPMGIPPMQ